MSDQILEDYKAYYQSRTEKYAGNPNYSTAYQAEKQLSDAMQSCSSLEEFQPKATGLNNACAIALVKDQSLMEKKHFEKHQEIVRVKAGENILNKIESCQTSAEVATMAVEETNKISMEISMDEAHRQFISDWDLTDEITIYENAIVPDKYKQSMMDSAQKNKDSLNIGVERLEKNCQDWQKGWKLVPEKNLEIRHKRLLPFSDGHIVEQLAKYKSIINR